MFADPEEGAARIAKVLTPDATGQAWHLKVSIYQRLTCLLGGQGRNPTYIPSCCCRSDTSRNDHLRPLIQFALNQLVDDFQQFRHAALWNSADHVLAVHDEDGNRQYPVASHLVFDAIQLGFHAE